MKIKCYCFGIILTHIAINTREFMDYLICIRITDVVPNTDICLGLTKLTYSPEVIASQRLLPTEVITTTPAPPPDPLTTERILR